MKRILTTLALGSVSLCLAAAMGCSDQTRNSDQPAIQPAGETEHRGESSLSDAPAFVEANWSLEAEPGAVRLHQRIDPVTGRTIELTDAQLEASEYDGQSALEHHASRTSQKAKENRITFGDPKAETQAIR